MKTPTFTISCIVAGHLWMPSCMAWKEVTMRFLLDRSEASGNVDPPFAPFAPCRVSNLREAFDSIIMKEGGDFQDACLHDVVIEKSVTRPRCHNGYAGVSTYSRLWTYKGMDGNGDYLLSDPDVEELEDAMCSCQNY